MKSRVRALCGWVLIAGLGLLVAACGGSSSAGGGSPSRSDGNGSASVVRQAADPGGRLRFVHAVLHAYAGQVKIVFTNESLIPHNLTIEQGAHGPDLAGTQIFRGGQRTLNLDLKPGRYTFFCDVPGHRMAGMHGTLIVK